jgi:hypothetical protein
MFVWEAPPSSSFWSAAWPLFWRFAVSTAPAGTRDVLSVVYPDLKTSLARVQLQAEGLREDWPEPPGQEALDRLLHDTVRLQIQLENSLLVAQPDGRLLSERIDAANAIARLAQDWPELQVRVTGNADIMPRPGFDAVVRTSRTPSCMAERASTSMSRRTSSRTSSAHGHR